MKSALMTIAQARREYGLPRDVVRRIPRVDLGAGHRNAARAETSGFRRVATLRETAIGG